MSAALVFCGETMPSAAVEHAIACVRAALLRDGVQAGDAVGVLMRNEPRMLVAMRAIRDIGAYAVPINWHWQPAEVAYVANDAPLRLLIAHEDLLAAAEAALPAGLARVRVPLSPALRAAYAISAGRSPDAPAWDEWIAKEPATGVPPASGSTMVYTSGTTGQPKGVRRAPLTPEHRRRIAEVNRLVFGVGKGARALLVTPLYHSAPGVFAMTALDAADLLVIEPRFDARRTLALIEEHRITNLYLVPTLMHRLLRLPAEECDRHDLSSLAFVLHGAAPCPPDVKRGLIAWWGPVVHEFYGASEAGPIAAIDSHEWLARPGSVGRVVPHARLVVADDHGRALPPRQPGLLYVEQAAYPPFTYNGREDLRLGCAHPHDPGLFTLGDVGWIDEDGFVTISDRRKDMVISGGVNIYPAEVEAVLCTHPAVRDCAVFGIPDEEFGEAVLGVVEPEPGPRPDPAQLLGWLRERLAHYKVPRRIAFADTLPREESGKIFKRKLREPYWQGAGRGI